MRGKIVHRDRRRQIVDFSGLRFGNNITPTDIDGYLDFQNKTAVIWELKHRDATLPRGQELALERLVDNSKIRTIAFVAAHNVDDPAQDINAAKALVTRYYWHGTWHDLDGTRTLLEMIHRFLKAGQKQE
jgi:hypothetical protein